MPALVAEHDARLRSAIENNGGYVFATGGDGFAAAFGRAADAVAAAERAQAAIKDLPDIRVRMGLNTGEVQERGGEFRSRGEPDGPADGRRPWWAGPVGSGHS